MSEAGEVELELDDLVESFLAQVQRGTPVDVEEFAAAHPAHAEELRGLLPILLDMETYSQRQGRAKADAEEERPPEIPGGDFRPLRVLGRGGMGVVWEAQQVSLDRKVALKVLSAPSRAGGESFVQEARIVAQLHHPNIVKVHGAGKCGDAKRFWYAMELVEGTEFGKHAFASPREVVGAVEQAARALAYAHRCGVVHRDIKPANLILDAAGTVRVTDFGLAAVLTGEGGEDDGGARDGTLRYMAPERLTDGVCSFAADQYALGVTLWELVAKRPVFTAASPRGLVECVRQGPVPPLAGVDADLAAVVAKATAHAPDDRYAGMSDFADDLRRWLANETVTAVSASVFRRLRLWTRRNPAAAAGAAAAILCAAAFVGALSVGYVRTSAALSLAARNAAVADSALGDVFRHMEAEQPSRRNAELMSALLPYYGELAENGRLASGKAVDANAALGVCALRSGDFAQAEAAFRRLCALQPSARNLNLLSETLLRRSNKEEANALARRVAEEFARSPKSEERFEAARALVALDRRLRVTKHRRKAFEIVSELLKGEPANPEYRFLNAVLLAETPMLGRGDEVERPFAALAALAAEHPDRSDYALAFVRAVERRMRGNGKPNGKLPLPAAADLEAALQAADRLLGRQPNVPDVVATVMAYRNAFVAHLRHTGDNRRAMLERTRTSGMLEMLSHNPETPDAARGRFVGADGRKLDYRQIVVGDRDAEPVTLVLFLHHRPQMGSDNALPLTSPALRTLVTRAETESGCTVFLVPQCPNGRANAWLGPDKQRPDKLLDTVEELVKKTAVEFNAPSNRVFAVGSGAGAAACRALSSRHPGVFERFLLAEPLPPGAQIPPKVLLFNDATLEALWR